MKRYAPVKPRIPPAHRHHVTQILKRADQLHDLPMSELRATFIAIREAWRTRLEEAWMRHCTRVARGGASPEDWDPAEGLYTEAELIDLVALVREVSWRVLHMRHFDVQITAGLVMIEGGFIQMKTGEGKTIVALFPSVLFGVIAQLDWEVVSGSSPTAPRRSVHVITANDYLAQRDALELRPVYAFFGLSVDFLAEPYDRLKRYLAYHCDVIYGAVAQFGFDLLRDQSVTRGGDKHQSRLYLAILDEVDHILIDEGRTPLVLSTTDAEHAEAQRQTVHLFNGLARALYFAPQVVRRHGSAGLELTQLGAQALSLLVAEYLEQPKTGGSGALGDAAALLADLCQELSKAPNASSALLQIGPGGELHLSPAAVERTRKVAQDLLEARIEDLQRDLFGALGWLIKFRQTIRNIAGLTREELSALRRYSIRAVPLIGSKRFFERLSARVPAIVAAFLNELRSALVGGRGRTFDAHLQLFTRLARHAGLLAETTSAAAARTGASQCRRDETASTDSIQNFGTDLQAYWLTPISRVVSRMLEAIPPTERLPYTAILKLVAAVFASGHLDHTINRSLTRFYAGLRGLMLFPTFYTYYELDENIVINELGRVLLRHLLREVLSRDLWAHRCVEPEETLADAVTRLYPEAEAILRRGLYAYIFRRRDVHYIVNEAAVELVNEFTGFREPNRRYSDILHLFLEAKENLVVHERQKTIGQISIQSFVRRYRRIAGMSATAAAARDEFKTVYGADVVEIPPNVDVLHVLALGRRRRVLSGEPLVYVPSKEYAARALRVIQKHVSDGRLPTVFTKDATLLDLLRVQVAGARPNVKLSRHVVGNLQRLPDQLYQDRRQKMVAAADLVKRLHRNGQPVLVAAPDIEAADLFADELAKRQPPIPFARLDARPEHAEREAEIIARAGEMGRVTIATQMAGRGVDILLKPEAVERGGLFVLGLERRESARWDEQASGRAARQGDLGSTRYLLSLDDRLLQIFGSERVIIVMQKLGMEEGEAIEHPLLTRAVRTAQRRIEDHHYRVRTMTLRTDEQLEEIRNEIFALRDATLTTRHPCRGHLHGDGEVTLGPEHPHAVCTKCLAADRTLDSRPSILFMRSHVQAVLTVGINECFSPVSFEESLVTAYASPDTPPAEWHWDELAERLSDHLRRRIRRSDLARPPGVADRLTRLRDRKAYHFPPPLSRWLERHRSPDRDAFVNPGGDQYPDLERGVLRERIRTLIAEPFIDRYWEQIASASEADGFSASAAYWALLALPLDRPPEQLLGSLLIFQETVRDREALRAYMREKLSGHLLVEGASEVDRRRRAELVSRLARFLGAFSVSRDTIENCLDEHEGSRTSGDAIRRWCMDRVLHHYGELYRRLGKHELYYRENQCLRSSIDHNFQWFLNNYETFTSGRRHEHVEDTIRELRLKTMQLWRFTRAEIAFGFGARLSEQSSGHPAARRPSAVTMSLSPVRIVDGPDPCGCGSGAEFRRCCGVHLYENIR